MYYFRFLWILILSFTILQATNTRAIYLQKYAHENRVALVIGNAKYNRFAPLANTLNDAKDIAKILKEKNFDLIHIVDGDLQSMENGVKEFSSKLKKGGVGFFYYAGHGLQINDSNYLIPVNSTISNAIDVKYKSLPVNYLIDMMENSHNRLNIIVLDACRNDPFKRGGGGLAQINSAKGMYIAFATGPGKVASDGDERNGLFTKHLLENIKRSNVTLDEVFNQTRKGVYNESNGEQLPWTSTSVIGNFYFNIDSGTASTTTPAILPTVTPKPQEIKTVRKATPNLANIFTDEKVKSFLKALMRANEGHDLYGVLEHYGRRVEPYFTTTRATHNDIYKDKKSHFSTWSKREYQLKSVDIKHHYEYLDTYYGDISYKFHWSRSNKERIMSGVSIVNATIKSVDEGFEITAIGTISDTTHVDKKLGRDNSRTITVDKRVDSDENNLNDNYRSQQTDYYPYVCYDQRIIQGDRGRITYLKYVGCKRYNQTCKSLGKEHFGKYPNDYRAHKALIRCQTSRPRFVD
ncbi:MAG: caspase family protein [Campylobacterota bacterium]|nr:caspase family protein [Campylobacterota bacterium]